MIIYKCAECGSHATKQPVVAYQDWASPSSKARTQGLGKFRCPNGCRKPRIQRIGKAQ